MLTARDMSLGIVMGVLLLTCAIANGADQSLDGKSKVCAVIAAESISAFKDAVERLKGQYNLRVLFALPPDAAIGYLPDLLADRVCIEGVSVIGQNINITEAQTAHRLDPDALHKVGVAWDVFRNYQGLGEYQPEPPDSMMQQHPLINDIVIEDVQTREEIWEKLTSEYLIGSVAIGIFMMESIGDLENWSNGPPDRMDSVFQKIIIGLEWMHDQALSRGANVEFWLDNGGYYASVPTNIEPITLVTDYDYLWMGEALTHIGYPSDEFYSYLNDLRSEFATDWATAVFVVDDWNDEDNMFPDSDAKFAYAKNWIQRTTSYSYVLMHGGPSLVVTYDNDNWGHASMPDVFCHEFCHIFGCPDEYADDNTCRDDSGSPVYPDCHSEYGYLFCQNYNCEACNPEAFPCLMKREGLAFGMCEWTYRHLGWYDSDGDGVCDPIDPNTGKLDYIAYVAPGDVLDIYTLALEFVKRINVTEKNSAPWDDVLHVIWDMTNFNGQTVVPANYILYKNGSSQGTFGGPHYGPFAIDFAEPRVEGEALVCSLTTDWAYVRLEVLDPDGQQVLYPVRDELHSRQERMEIDLSVLPYSDSYTAKYYGWLPDSSLSSTHEFVFASEEELVAVTELDAGNAYNEPMIELEWLDENPHEDGFAVERKDSTGGYWQVVGTSPPATSWGYYDDYSLAGSEVYRYRVRPYTSNGQDGPWCNEFRVKSRPMPPENIECYVFPGRMNPSQPSDKIEVSWSPPQNQLLLLDHYVVWRQVPHQYMGEKFGPIYDTSVVICPNPKSEMRNFYVYCFDSEGDSSVVLDYCGAIFGQESWCPDEQSKIASTAEGESMLPGEFRLDQNSPNPFNPTTVISFCLPASAYTELSIYNLLGQRVATLVDEYLDAGSYSIEWNGRDQNEVPVSSGIYMYILLAGNESETKKMLLLK